MEYQSRQLYLQNPRFITPSIRDAENAFWAKWLTLHQPGDAELFHYTKLDGMRGILQTRSLWLSHVSCLNDRSEIQYGQQLVDSVLREGTEKEESGDVRIFIEKLSMMVQSFANQAVHQVFVACFCESGNLLSQWRGYSHNGQGYCLGFKFSSTTRIAADPKAHSNGKEPYLRKVIYDEARQRELVQEYLKGVTDAVRVALASDNYAPIGDHRASLLMMAIQSANIIYDMLMCFKHPAFESENEWRLVRAIRGDLEPHWIHFRESSGELIPYRPMHIYDTVEGASPSFPVRSVGFGPTLEPGRTRSAISLLMHHLASIEHPINLDANLPISSAGYSVRPQQ